MKKFIIIITVLVSLSGAGLKAQSEVELSLEQVIQLAEEHDWFDSEFVESVSEQYEEKGILTEKQISALENIREMLLSR